jgi:hypothetical protein
VGRKCASIVWCCAVAACLVWCRAAGAADIVWADFGYDALFRAAGDGSGVRQITPAGQDNSIGVTFDPVAGQLYWGENVAARLRRADLDVGGGIAGNIVNLYTGEPGESVEHVAVDRAGGKVYWSNDGDDQIMRANLDGSGAESFRFTGNSPYGIDIDPVERRLYWADFTDRTIKSVSLENPADVRSVYHEEDAPHGLAVDPVGRMVYFTTIPLEESIASVQRVGFEGGEPEILVEDLELPRAIALDLSAGRMYWTEDGGPGEDRIASANLDGTDVRTIVTDGLRNPAGIVVLVPEPAAGGAALAAFAYATLRRRSRTMELRRL